MEETTTTPLSGLRVLDIGNMIAGPMVGSLLGDFGADVVKVEHPEAGDDLRNWPPFKEGRSLWWKVTNRNKRLITLNLSKPEGRDLLLAMLPRFDILIENYRPGTMERWGLGYDVLARIHPKIIMVRVSGYGQTGPYSRRPGYATIAEAMSGIPSFTGFPDMPPTMSAFPLGDSLAGTFGALAALIAIYHREVKGTGQGQVVDVSLYEPFFRLMEPQVIAYDQLGEVKRRNGNRMAEDSPRNIYATADGGYVAISAGSQRTFERLAAAIGQPELGKDPRFCSTEQRVLNADALDTVFAEWFADQSLRNAMETMNAFDVVAGPIYTIEDIFEDPHYLARENIVTVADPDFGNVRMQGVVPKFSHTPGRIAHPGLAKGAHNDEIYREVLGLGDEQIESYKNAGVI